MRLKTTICAGSCLLAAAPGYAATKDGFDLSGTMRLRYEAISNQPRAGFGQDDDLFNLRTTLLAHYQSGGFTIAGELWDSRVYGQDPATPVSTGEVNTIEPVQAYVAWKGKSGGNTFSVQAGRFMLNVGSRRIVAADDYRNTTNGYTGVRADFATANGLTVTAVYVLPQQRRPDDAAGLRDNEVHIDHEGFDQVLWGGTVAKAKAIDGAMIEASYFHFGEHDEPGRPTRDRSLDTYGARIIRDPAVGKADFEVESLYQSGSISASTQANAARQSVAAWFTHAAVGYSFPGPLKAHVSLNYDYASGDAPGGHYAHFDTLFGMRRADLAPGGLYNAVTRANISSPGVHVAVTPSPRWDAMATYHPMWLADRTDSFSTTGVRDATGRSGNFAGHQFDTRLRWWVQPSWLRFEFDGVVLVKGRFLEDAPNANPGGTTVYTSFNLTTFF